MWADPNCLSTTLNKNFKVNLGGVIRLLSDHLYSGPDVYVRELLQNAVDAITARQLLDPTVDGSIRVELTGHDTDLPTVLVEDNGIGLTEEEVHQFLATIGQSSKSGDFSRDDFIGQFGIGLLSGFLVSDAITVITRSATKAASPVEWKGRADGTYSVRKLESEFSVGTRVYLRCKPGSRDMFAMEQVAVLLRHYGHHLPHTIQFTCGPQSIEINDEGPWHRNFASEAEWRQACLEYGKEMFGVEFLDAIFLTSDCGQVEGVAFVLPFAASPASKQAHRVYLKNMLLAESVDKLLPDWAFFVRCVINANRLRPNAARDSFYEDDVLAKARSTLGNALRQYLVGLAQYDRAKLDHLIQLHYMPIKALAVEDDEFLRLFVDWLPFETSLGRITLEEHCRMNDHVRYVRTAEQFRQISSVASAQRLCVFNGGYAYDAELLERVGHEFPGRKVECIDPADLVQNFAELTLDEREQIFELVKLADTVLQEYKCTANARKFAPVDLPTLFVANDSATFLRSIEQSQDVADDMWGEILETLSHDARTDSYSQLVLNFRNPLIQRLATVENRDLVRRIIQVLYLQSLLLGNYPLAPDERNILASGLLGLLDIFLGDSET